MANITNELNNIKNATYGKDVRGSIHDGIDKMNKETESTTARQQQLDEQFDQLVINAGNSNAEVVAARVDTNGTAHATIGKRLDNFDSQLDTKAPKTTTDSLQTQVNNLVVNGDGTQNLEVIQARNGYSVLNDRLNFLESSSVSYSTSNIIKTIGKKQGSYQATNGTFVSGDTNKLCTDFIDVSKVLTITSNAHTIMNVSAYSYFKYDKNYNFLGYVTITSPQNIYTIESGVYYITTNLYYNSTMKPLYDENTIYINLKSYDTSLLKGIDNKSKIDNINTLLGYEAINLFNGVTVTGSLDAITGSLGATTDTSKKATDFIEINGTSNIVYCNFLTCLTLGVVTTQYLWCYDSNKAFLGYVQSTQEKITLLNNTKYVRQNVKTSTLSVDFSKYYIKEPFTKSDFSRIVELEKAIINSGSQWNNKKWCAFGTSITNIDNEGKYANYLRDMSGMLLTNKGISGGRITSSILSNIKSTTLTSYDLITLEGFVNDWYYNSPLGVVGDTTSSTFAGAIYDGLSYIMQNSNATIVCITDHTGQLYNSIDSRATKTNTLGLRMIDYTKMFIEVCKFLNVPIIEAGQKAMINEFTANKYLIDQIHHTELGGKQFANAIWSELKNISPKVS